MTDNPEADPNYTDILVYKSDVEAKKKEYEQGGWACINDTVVDSETGRIRLAFRRKPQTGTITVKDGVVVALHAPGQTPATVGGQPLYETLKALEKDHWRVDGELPPFTTEGQYEIKIIRDSRLKRVTG